MKQLLAALAGLLISCASPASDEGDANQTQVRLVEVVFFNFYLGEDVELTVNDDMIFSGKLEMKPEDEDTGFNLSMEIAVPTCASYKLVVNEKKIESDICLESSDRFVYVNPNLQPLIEASPSEALD